MKYYKVIEKNKVTQLAKQPNDIIPSFGIEITPEEYNALDAAFKERQTKIAEYVEKIKSGVITLNDVPAEYYNDAYEIINTPEPDPTENPDYMAGYEQALLDLSEVE